MPDAIPRFLNHPTLNSPRQEHGRAPAAWTVLMQKGAQFKVDPQWFGTPLQAQMAQEPSWCVANPILTLHERPHRRVEQLLQGLQP